MLQYGETAKAVYMDRIRKSVGEQQMTLFIVISMVSSLALACFDGFLTGLILIANMRKNHIVRHNRKLRKAIHSSKGFYEEKYLLRYA
ncbi:MAG: hypothetical protein M3044_14020 [Thermoproteota archaeon]|nr:hypothetical protein [Thermoproteota archaeon]